MYALLACHFRVEGGGQQLAGTHCNNSSCPLQIGCVGGVGRIRRLHLGQDLDPRSHPLHPWAADENGVHRRHAVFGGAEVQAPEVEVGLERLPLAPEGIAPHGDVQAAEGLLRIAGEIRGGVCDVVREEDHSGAGAVDREAFGDVLAQRVREFEGPRQLVDGGGFSSGNNEPVEAVKFRRTSDPDAGGAGRLDGAEMLAKVALKCQDADAQS